MEIQGYMTPLEVVNSARIGNTLAKQYSTGEPFRFPCAVKHAYGKRREFEEACRYAMRLTGNQDASAAAAFTNRAIRHY